MNRVEGQAPKGLGWAPNLAYRIVADHAIDFWPAGEHLPLADSRVTMRPEGNETKSPVTGQRTE